jgi:Flp pilus assembly protein TadD
MRLSLNAMKVGGGSSSMLLNSGVAAAKRNDFASARRYLSAAPDRDLPALDLVIIDMMDSKYYAAIARTRRMFTKNNNRMIAASLAGQAFDNLGRPSDAIRAYKTAISLLPAERSFALRVEILRVALPQLLTAAMAREAELIAANDRVLRWRGVKRMELNR